MTQVAEPETPASAAPGRISHWIGGRIVPGTSGRQGDVYDPATGSLTKHVDFASVEEVDAAVAAARAAFPAWRATSLSKRTDILFKIRNLVDQRRHELAAHLTAEHGKVPSDALGEIARGLENLEFACGIPNLLKGGFTRAGQHGRRRLPDPPAARRRGRHHAVQLPGDGADVDVRDRDRVRQHVHPQAVREGPLSIDLHGRAAARGRRPGRRVQRRPRRQGRGRRDPRAPGHRRCQLRRLDADRPLHLRDGHGARQARPGARWRQEPHDRAARRRHRHGRRCGRLGRLRVGRRAVHGHRHGRRRGRRGRPLVDAIAKRLPKVKVGPGSDPAAEMGPLVTRQHRDKVAGYLDSDRSRAPRSSPTGASTRCTARATASSWACR